MDFEFNNDTPIYKQLIDYFKIEISKGTYQPGDKLPSVRELAASIKINPNTIQRALQELEDNGLIYTKRTSGKFISEDSKVFKKLKEELAKEKIETFITDMNKLDISIDEIIKILNSKRKER